LASILDAPASPHAHNTQLVADVRGQVKKVLQEEVTIALGNKVLVGVCEKLVKEAKRLGIEITV